MKFIIKDTGRGMSPAVLEEIKGPFNKETDQNGFAIGNIHQRLRLKYQNNFTLSIESQEDVGTTVTLLLPFTEK